LVASVKQLIIEGKVIMTNVVNTVKSVSQKVYNNGKTYAENVKEGIFLPAKALKNHQEVMDKLDANDKKMDLILSKLSK
tara:strand:+ start:820 stop:1056 length:237 start_codon:yes stop_codon:yes gene_type:complete